MYPKPYIEYLVHFHGLRDYFECHEILEEHWKSIPPAVDKHHWVGLIQIAVGLYHQRRNNFKGAYRMLNSALKIIQRHPSDVSTLGLDVDLLIDRLRNRLNEIETNIPYTSFDLPVQDPVLLASCEKECGQLGCAYGTPSDLNNQYLIHKHRLRDRQDVIEERLAQKELRKKKREG